MQFSFDKFSKKSNQDQPSSMKAASPNAGNESADERLRKAIERNRAKLAKKSDGPSPSNFQAPPPRPAMQSRSFDGTNSSNNSAQSTLLERMRANREQNSQAAQGQPQRPLPSRPVQKVMAEEEQPAQATRKIITDPDKIELNGTLRKSSSSPAVVNYTDSQIVPRETIHKKLSAKRKLKTKTKFDTTSTMSWFVKGSWLFCIFLVARLVFSEGGVVEYYQKTSNYSQKAFELETTKQENIELMKELESIQNDGKYQKKLVRDHLGYIARDEYLILFSKNPTQEQLNSEVSSI